MISDNDELQEFRNEATDLLEEAEKCLLEIERGAPLTQHYAAIFRAFHSVKGASGMLSLDALQRHMHQLENHFSAVKEKAALHRAQVNYFLEGLDAARKILEGQNVPFTLPFPEDGAAAEPASTPAPERASSLEPAAAASATSAAVTTGIASSNASALSANSRGIAYLCDDEPDILELLSELLEAHGIRTRSFLSARDLLRESKEAAPDLVITDLKMPEMSGIEMLQEIRKFNGDLPVIIVSGFITTESLLQAIESGIFAALEKPIKEQVLVSYAMAAIRQGQHAKLIRRSLNLLLYQFTDLDDFLQSQGKADVADTIRNEIKILTAEWRGLQSQRKKAGP